MRLHSLHEMNAPLWQRYFQPIFDAVEGARNTRVCKSFPDREWLAFCIRRSQENQKSGRAFLEFSADRLGKSYAHSLFFESLKSKRRLQLLREVSLATLARLFSTSRNRDPFRSDARLDGYDLYAGDGHYIEHACWDEAIDGTKYATGHFYGLDLRSHGLFHLTAADRSNGRKKEHDMHALKRLGSEELRRHALKGRKVMWVWDRACIDVKQWLQWKHLHGIYFISRAKENMDLTPRGPFEYDKEDAINANIISDHLVHISSQAVRCVQYTCPLSNKTFDFLTTDMVLPPGLIAALYRARWDIEKTFDETKRKLEEGKSWASSDNAKNIQAESICLAHNLMTLLEISIEARDGITNERENHRREKRLEKALAKARRYQWGSLPPLVLQTIRRCTQRSLVFIRWIRNNLDRREPWEAIIAPLRLRLMGCQE